jgi:gluconolactonase
MFRTTWPLRIIWLLSAPWLLAFGSIAACLPTATLHGAEPAQDYPTLGTIHRDDSRINDLVPEGAVIEKLAEGFEWTEGPAWDKRRGRLLFSDIPNNVVLSWSPNKGLKTFLKPAGYTGTTPRGGESGSNGLLFDAKGHLILCQHGDRRVARLIKGKQFKTLVENFEGKRFNSPNDAVMNRRGDLYFTDPPYGLEKQQDDPAREMDYCGVYLLNTQGKLTLLTKELSRPNGVALSPDEKTLYVAVSDPKRAIWMAYDVDEQGMIDHGRVFFDATHWVGKKPGLPDGMAVDQQGNLFATGPGGVHIFNPQGEHLGSIETGEATANCTFGGDGSVLYITADMYLCRIKLNTKGLGF